MRKRFLASYPLIGTKHKPSAIHLQQRSPYYWWWAYLKRNLSYLDCCERGGQGEHSGLYADFGDVRSDDFRSWWGAPQHRGDYLFAEQPLDLSVEKIDAAQVAEMQKVPNVMFVAVNMDLGRRHLQKKFAELVAKDHKGKRGRKALRHVASTARYPLHRNFTTHNLKVMLMVYDAVTANEKLPKGERKPLWAVGESLKLVPSAMPEKDDSPIVTSAKHNTMTMTVSRYAKQARQIVKNTVKGEFPNSDP
jgi:hypothetical protein